VRGFFCFGRKDAFLFVTSRNEALAGKVFLPDARCEPRGHPKGDRDEGG
jgi:hypothetical protein